MMMVLEESGTALSRDGKRLFRRVYLSSDGNEPLPTDAAAGSLALIKVGDTVVTKMLFPDGKWGRL